MFSLIDFILLCMTFVFNHCFFKISYFVIALVLRKVKYCIDLMYIYHGSFQYSLKAITHMYLYTILQRPLSPMNLLTIIWGSLLHEPLYNSLELFTPYEHLHNSLETHLTRIPKPFLKGPNFT